MQIRAGLPREAAYSQTLYILAGLLAVGFVCNLLVRPVAARWFMRDGETGPALAATAAGESFGIGRGGFNLTALLAWAVVGIPLLWGVWITLSKAIIIFK